MIIAAFSLSSCGTIVGGSKYNAYVEVAGKPQAKIYYQGQVIGTGSGFAKINRSELNRLTFSVKEDGCKEQEFNFSSSTFRVGALCGSIAVWGIFGVLVDAATGAFMKPDINVKGVRQLNYKNFRYELDYANCLETKREISLQVLDVVHLKNGSIIKGTITEQVPNGQLKIETRDGSLFVFKSEEIDYVIKEESK